MRGKDGLEHEMHHQSAERALIEPVEVEGTYRPACFGQRRGNGALLRRDEIAGGVADEIIGTGELGEIWRDARTPPLAVLADDGDEMLRSAVEIELELAVLIDWAKRSHRCRPLALLAETLAPELHIPGGEAREAVRVG